MSLKFKKENELEPIPIPLSQWLREFRVRVIPIIVFIIAGIFVYINWTTRVVSPDFMGAVYSSKAQLKAPIQGVLTDFYLEPFSQVQAGEVIGRVLITDPAVIEANLAVINAQIEYLRSSREPEIDRERNILNYESMKIELMQERINLSSLKIRKLRSEQSLNRNRVLFEGNLISEDEFEQVKLEYDLLVTEVEQKELLVNETATRLEQIAPLLEANASQKNPTLAAINVQAQQLRLIEAELMPREILSPFDGIVRMTHKKSGVVVIAGDLIAEIETRDPEFIIGFVRQPFSVKPEPGMAVEVRSRRAGRASFTSEIAEVGAHISFIDTLLLRPGVNFETGLPVKVHLSEDFNLFPGEVVDLILRP